MVSICTYSNKVSDVGVSLLVEAGDDEVCPVERPHEARAAAAGRARPARRRGAGRARLVHLRGP